MRIPTEILIIPAAFLSLANMSAEIGGVAVDSLIPPHIEGSGVYSAPVRPGEVAGVEWTLTKRTDCGGENWRVWDGAGGFHITEAARPTGLDKTDGPRRVVVPTQIPRGAPDGTLRLRVVGYYQCPGAARVPFELGPVIFTVDTRE